MTETATTGDSTPPTSTTLAPQTPDPASPAAPNLGTPPASETLPPISAEQWKSALPKDLRESDHVAKHEDLGALVKEFVNAQSLIGRKGILPPGEHSTIEDWARFYKQLGRPDSPEGYDLSKIERDDSIPWDTDTEQAILSEMYDAGLNPQQVERIMGRYVELTQTQVQGLQAKAQEASELAVMGLKREFGAAYDAKIEAAQRGFQKLFGDQAAQVAGIRLADGTSFGDNADVIRAMASTGEQFMEAGILGTKQTRFAKTPAEAQAEIESLRLDESFMGAWMKADHPGHKAAIERMSGLYEAAHQGE